MSNNILKFLLSGKNANKQRGGNLANIVNEISEEISSGIRTIESEKKKINSGLNDLGNNISKLGFNQVALLEKFHKRIEELKQKLEQSCN